jgi:hypothetical protein
MGGVDDEDCTCEAVPNGQFGVVTNEERIVRVVLPEHINKKGELKQGLIARTQLLKGQLSVTRCDRINAAEMTAQADAVRVSANADKVEGIACCVTGEVRSLRNANGKQAVCVVDHPVRGNEAHAHLGTSTTIEDPELLGLRDEILDKFRPLRQVTDIYN